MDQAKLDALRLMYAEFLRGLDENDPEDAEALAALDVLAGALVGFVPELIDELERLRAEDGRVDVGARMTPEEQQQAAYDAGWNEGRAAGFTSGEAYGRGLQEMQDELKPSIGFALGILVSVIAVLVMKTLGVMP
jgi:flagellar biosynthesis/type III secretory pathway protein FliH